MSAPEKLAVRYHRHECKWILSSEGHKDSVVYIRADLAKPDWTKPCQCKSNERTGETWCCNHCGKPVKDSSDQSAEIDLLRNGNNELNQEIEKMSAEIERLTAYAERLKRHIDLLLKETERLDAENERLKGIIKATSDLCKAANAALTNDDGVPFDGCDNAVELYNDVIKLTETTNP